LTDLPPKTRQVISLEPSAALKKLIQKELQTYEQYADTLKEDENPPEFSEISKVRKEIGIQKVSFVIDYIKEILNEESKVVIFGHHLEVLDRIQCEFKEQSVRIDGRVSSQDRQSAVDAFQNDPKIKIFLGGIQAAGTGLTLTASRLVVFAESDWVPGTVSQAEDRCHRIGQKDCVTVQHIVLAGSLDERMTNTIIRKQEIIDKALDK
jgi:SWI/SNF-related matrix-associated actin-dependent regulator 1 of chromatin subfamily A